MRRIVEFPEDANWHGLARLYGVNSSLFAPRPDYTLGPEDWHNFQKDVDSILQLLDDFERPETGSGDEGSGVGLWVTAGPRGMRLSTMPTFRRSIYLGNDLPERSSERTPPGHLTHTSHTHHQLDQDEMSGNGITELETRNDFLFSSNVKDVIEGEEEDVFEAQGYLHIPQSPKIPAQNLREPQEGHGSGIRVLPAASLFQKNP